MEDIRIENQFGSVEASYTVSPGNLSVSQTRKLIKGDAEKEKITDLLQISSSQSRLSIPTLIFDLSAR